MRFIADTNYLNAFIGAKNFKQFFHCETPIAFALKLFIHHQANDKGLLLWMREIKTIHQKTNGHTIISVYAKRMKIPMAKVRLIITKLGFSNGFHIGCDKTLLVLTHLKFDQLTPIIFCHRADLRHPSTILSQIQPTLHAPLDAARRLINFSPPPGQSAVRLDPALEPPSSSFCPQT